MALADRIPGRWQKAWNSIDGLQVDELRDVIRWAEAGPWPADRLAEEAGIHAYDIRNFLGGARSGHRPGLRLLWFVGRLRQQSLAAVPEDIRSKIDRLGKIVDRFSDFEPDDDYFFRHLQRLEVSTEDRCRALCRRLSGQYYSHRLSRNPGKIIRSHYEFQKFSPYNRLPHVINRLRYGAVGDNLAIERTAEGQLVEVADTLVLIGLVYQGYRRVGKEDDDKPQYDGIQINLFPINKIGRSVTEGLFLSYVYNARYEMGRMKLVRKADRKTKFDPDQVGEFTVDQVREMEPDLNLADLAPDVSPLLGPASLLGAKSEQDLLVTCLSFILNREELYQNRLGTP